MLDELLQNFRISVRGLLRTPLFAVTVIWTLETESPRQWPHYEIAVYQGCEINVALTD